MPVPDLYHEPDPLPLVRGITANAVAAPGDALYVILPSFDGITPWGPCPWTPHGNTLPAKGTACLVAVDDQGLKWVVAWVGGWS